MDSEEDVSKAKNYTFGIGDVLDGTQKKEHI